MAPALVRACAATAVFLDPATYKNAFIPVYDEIMTPEQMAGRFTEATGIKAR